jgi:hypothetical protein
MHPLYNPPECRCCLDLDLTFYSLAIPHTTCVWTLEANEDPYYIVCIPRPMIS